MARVRKRQLPSGLIRWQAGYVDGAGERRFKMFERKSDAEAWLVETQHDVVRGLHTPGSISPTVKEAAALWIKRCNEKGLEPRTVQNYEEHVDLHIVPFIGAKKLAEITVPALNSFADQLRAAGRSADMIKRVMLSLGGIFKEARRRGLSNAAPTVGFELDLPDREDPRPIIPAKSELSAIIEAATKKGHRARPFFLTAIFCGPRPSEMRGLRWIDVDFEAKGININQRADASHRIGKLKSKAAYRFIPCPPIVLNALREWKLLCPKGDAGLVFPNGIGKVESHANLLERDFEAVQLAAGVTETVQATDNDGKALKDAAGAPVMATSGKYGLHSLRHACASLWIESGYNPKQIQRLMGHSSIKVTFDVYGHLFADPDADQKAAENVQARLLGR